MPTPPSKHYAQKNDQIEVNYIDQNNDQQTTVTVDRLVFACRTLFYHGNLEYSSFLDAKEGELLTLSRHPASPFGSAIE